jgi:poly-gamma-glutamate capsule biosynthesis protein CapA/YwtB (metallophosphatase superfamily)
LTRPLAVGILGAILLLAMGAASAAPVRRAPVRPDFTLVMVGDLILPRPVSMLAQPGAFPQWRAFADTLKLLRSGDITYGNLETTIFDLRTFTGAPYSWDGDWPLSSVPAVADDLKVMGIDLVSRANNHALDWGIQGMRATAAWVARAGLVTAGAGSNLAEASRAAFAQTPAGKVALVSMVTTFRSTTNALAVSQGAPYGRPGVDGLGLSASAVLDAASYRAIANIACSFGAVRPCAVPASLELFGTSVRAARAGERPFTYDYAVNRKDFDRIVRAVATAKAAGAKFVIAALHAHEASTDEAPPRSWQGSADFLRPLAHRLIDAGADAFVATGIHHVQGIEVYKGKPIFYGIANFFFSDIQEPLPADLYESTASGAYGFSISRLLERSFEHPDRITDADLTNVMNAASFGIKGAPAAENRTFQGFVAQSEFDGNGRISRIRLYPIDLGYGEKLTQSGIPRRAGDTIANMVLNRVISLSRGRGVIISKVRQRGYLIGVATALAGSG